MRVLVIGRGGREHALAWRLKKSPSVEVVYCAPGNPGTAVDAVNVPILEDENRQILQFCQKERIDLVVIGPEAPLVAGLSDYLRKYKVDVFGPSQEAAQLEGSKVFCKKLLRKANIPTAEGRVFNTIEAVENFFLYATGSCVVKADGLAAGKGVIVCDNPVEGHAAAKRMLVDGEFGRAGETILVEDRLQGEEASVLAITDGSNILTLAPCQDHKRAFDNDLGPNTGGMGAFCPAGIVTPEILKQVEERILVPLVHQMRHDGMPFRGVLYAGLMLTRKGPQVLEFNVRFGDPECQPLMMRLRGDFAKVLKMAARGNIGGATVEYDPRPALCVVMASGGYPGSYKTGANIRGLADVPETEELKVFHAGTMRDDDRILTAGGRVLGVTALGDDMAAARATAYQAVAKIRYTDVNYRTDIAGPPTPAATQLSDTLSGTPTEPPSQTASNELPPVEVSTE